jgi:four helix bundle protein
LRISQGSLKELETHLILAARVNLAPASKMAPVLQKCENLAECCVL